MIGSARGSSRGVRVCRACSFVSRATSARRFRPAAVAQRFERRTPSAVIARVLHELARDRGSTGPRAARLWAHRNLSISGAVVAELVLQHALVRRDVVEDRLGRRLDLLRLPGRRPQDREAGPGETPRSTRSVGLSDGSTTSSISCASKSGRSRVSPTAAKMRATVS